MNKFKTMFKISLGSILRLFSIMCLRLEAMHVSPLHKPAANLPGWMDVGVRFLVAVFQARREEKLASVWVTLGMSGTRLCAPCTIWGVGHGAWSLESEESADGMRGEWQISSLCNFITGTVRWSCLTESISTRLLWISFPGCICSHDTYPLSRKVIYSPAGWVTA